MTAAHLGKAAARYAGWALVINAATAGLLALCLLGLSRTGAMVTMAVTSDSMAPVMHAGDLIVSTPAAAADLEVGDVVTVEGEDGLLTHRIDAIAPGRGGAERELVLHGDANGPTEVESYVVTEALVLRAVLTDAAQVRAALSRPPVAAGTAAALVLVIGVNALAPPASRTRARHRAPGSALRVRRPVGDRR